jgi:hypothetical protein
MEAEVFAVPEETYGVTKIEESVPEISKFRQRRLKEQEKKSISKIKRNLKSRGMEDSIDMNAFQEKFSERLHQKELELLEQIEKEKDD